MEFMPAFVSYTDWPPRAAPFVSHDVSMQPRWRNRQSTPAATPCDLVKQTGIKRDFAKAMEWNPDCIVAFPDVSMRFDDKLFKRDNEGGGIRTLDARVIPVPLHDPSYAWPWGVMELKWGSS